MAVKPDQVGSRKDLNEFPTNLDELELWLDRVLLERTDQVLHFKREGFLFRQQRERAARRELPEYLQLHVEFPRSIRVSQEERGILIERYKLVGWDNVELWDSTDGSQSYVFMKNDPTFKEDKFPHE